MRFKHIFALIIIIAFLGGCAKDHYSSRYKSVDERKRYAKEHNLNRLPPSDVPLVMNERVIAWLEYFQGRGRDHMQRYLERSGRYIDLMQDILRQNNLPEDLIYVALIESGFNDNAYSKAHAVGPWQFIRGTGKRYGLVINNWLDERRDPIKATWAAAKYLQDLYNEFGDWYLAMAGYNAGEGKVRKVIKSSGTKDYWEIVEGGREYFRAETRDYVPKFIAAAIIAKTPENFGFKNLEYESPLDYEVAPVDTQTDLKVIAECAGISHEEVVRLNAHLVGGTTPPNVSDYLVKLPVGTTEVFKEKYAAVPQSERILIVYHKIRRGDTIGTIANRYGVSANALLSANDIPYSKRNRISVGRTLVIPKNGQARSAQLSEASVKTPRNSSSVPASTGVPKKHKIRSGETLWSISKKYGVPVRELMALNNLDSSSRIHAGKTIVISRPPRTVKTSAPIVANGSTHTLRRGETLGQVAGKYRVKLSQLMAWNNIENPSRVKAGLVLTISDPGETVPRATNAPVSSAQTHKVAKGEALVLIARKYGVTVQELMAWNNIKDPRSVRAGQILKVQKATAGQTPTSDSPNVVAAPVVAPITEDYINANNGHSPSSFNYQVKPGDTLWDIARRHNVTISDIQTWNNLSDPSQVRPGDMLAIKRK
ncbi:MAG: LysM peptidoglycan-binding domain-containing protein [Pseudomonadota bacterium]